MTSGDLEWPKNLILLRAYVTSLIFSHYTDKSSAKGRVLRRFPGCELNFVFFSQFLIFDFLRARPGFSVRPESGLPGWISNAARVPGSKSFYDVGYPTEDFPKKSRWALCFPQNAIRTFENLRLIFMNYLWNRINRSKPGVIGFFSHGWIISHIRTLRKKSLELSQMFLGFSEFLCWKLLTERKYDFVGSGEKFQPQSHGQNVKSNHKNHSPKLHFIQILLMIKLLLFISHRVF